MMLYQSEILRELHTFAAFCREKPADEEYQYANSRECACGQYLRAKGAFRYDWSYGPVIANTPGLARLNELASRTAARAGFCGWGKFGDLLRLVEREIEQELHRQEDAHV